jgi:hypothetical protein
MSEVESIGVSMDSRYISDLLVVIRNERDWGVRLRQKQFEDAYKKLIKASSVNLNVQDSADSNIPRLALQNELLQISASQQHIQLNASFYDLPKENKPRLEKIKTLVTEFAGLTKTFLKTVKALDVGIVISVAYPCNTSQDKIFPFIKKRLLSPAFSDDISGIDLKVSYILRREFNLNFSPAIYQLRAADFSQEVANGKLQIHVELDKMPLTETGIDIKIDVNDKPSFTKHSDLLRRSKLVLNEILAITPASADKLIGIKE